MRMEDELNRIASRNWNSEALEPAYSIRNCKPSVQILIDISSIVAVGYLPFTLAFRYWIESKLNDPLISNYRLHFIQFRLADNSNEHLTHKTTSIHSVHIEKMRTLSSMFNWILFRNWYRSLENATNFYGLRWMDVILKSLNFCTLN